MRSAYEDFLRIVDVHTPDEIRLVAMRGFAEQLNWTPSYEFRASFGVEAAADHLVVEHGLENTAIISFLRAPYRARDLDSSNLRALLAISYNNLIEWHIFVSQTDIRQVNNLAEASREPQADRLLTLSPSEFEQTLSAAAIDNLQSAIHFNRTLRACDDAFIQVLARWKRLLKADYPNARNEHLSALFNAMIFVRCCEDRHLDRPHRANRVLLDVLSNHTATDVDLPALLADALNRTGVAHALGQFVEPQLLEPFKALDRATAWNLCTDFYAPREAPYDFNFALMSKHALSRIYERYVALLSPDLGEDEQLSFVNPIPTEESPRKTGAVYTPQFIAGFFSRFIRDNTTPRKFRSLRVIDPACGSGIFLRTLLELQCNPTAPGTTPSTIREAFLLAEGIDRDPNACQATRLSLAMLHLVATGELPRELNVRCGNAIQDALEGRIQSRGYGAVITNPPYVKLDHLSASDRTVYEAYLTGQLTGRIDAYLAFLRLCLDACEPGGFVCLVLPQAFLHADNAVAFRKTIPEQFDVRCLVDLSSISIFEGVGAYSILLILQRRSSSLEPAARAQIAQVSEFVGSALQACLDGRTVDSPYHRVFTVPQSFFRRENWAVVSPEDLAVNERLSHLPKLSQFVSVVQGLVTGADDVFILPRSKVPRGEEAIYVSYLPDAQIMRYKIPARTEEVVFYPYLGFTPLTEGQLQERYPKTWQYLLQNKPTLTARGPVRAGKTLWWRPERPRKPDRIRRPKIVCPHLMLTPRFALDIKGQFVVSRSPFMIAADPAEEEVILKFYLAILNSSISAWFLRNYAPKYSRGYNRVEANLFPSLPVPDFTRVRTADINRVLGLVDKIQSSKVISSLDLQLDSIIAQLYGFSEEQRERFLGIQP